MAHFAKIDDDNRVVRVTKLDNSLLLDGDNTEVEAKGVAFLERVLGGGRWIQTSYNTNGGEHPDGKGLRKNYAGLGHIYDERLDAFYRPSPHPSWVLNEETCRWEAPVPKPEVEVVEGVMPPVYLWNEDDQKWDEVLRGVESE